MIEAWILAKLRMGICGVRTAMRLHGSLQDGRWTVTDGQRLQQGPMLWEARTSGPWANVQPCAYDKKMAESSLITWADITDVHTGTWLPWSAISARSAGRLSGVSDSGAYQRLIAHLDSPANTDARNRWRQHVTTATHRSAQAPITAPSTWDYERVVAARRTAQCFGGWEYLMKWVGYDTPTWEKGCSIEGRSVPGSVFMQARQDVYLAASLHEELQRRMRIGTRGARGRAAYARAAAEGDPEATPQDVSHLYDIFKEHAMNVAHIDGQHDAWSESPNRDATHAAAKVGAQTWETEPWRTNHKGGTETVQVTRGNKVQRETRKCTDLDNSGIASRYQITRDEPHLARTRLEDYALADALADVQSNIDNDAPRPQTPMQPPPADPTGAVPGSRAIMSGDRTPQLASTPYWTTGGGPTGVTEVMNDSINADPMARVFQRCDALETGTGVRLRTGVRVTCDQDERNVLKRCGRIE